MSTAALNELEQRVKVALGVRYYTLWLVRCSDRSDWTARWASPIGLLRKRYADTLTELLGAILEEERTP